MQKLIRGGDGYVCRMMDGWMDEWELMVCTAAEKRKKRGGG